MKIKKAKTLSATVKKLKANKTYYVRIRTYATVTQDGVVNALKPGDVVLTATGGSGKKTNIAIQVDEAEELTLTILEDDDFLPDIDDGFDEVIVM